MFPENPVRPWRIVAEELSHEKNAENVTRLADELNQALDEQEIHKQSATDPENEKERISAA